MYEKKVEPLASVNTFTLRLFITFSFAAVLIFCALGIGTSGFMYFENMSLIDAFNTAAMILTTVGPNNPISTDGGKIFEACFAILSSFAFLSIIGFIFAPIIHRFFHKFCLDASNN